MNDDYAEAILQELRELNREMHFKNEILRDIHAELVNIKGNM